MNKTLQAIPIIGSGISYRLPICMEIVNNGDDISVLEIISEHFISERGHTYGHSLDELCDKFNVIPHGLNLSICSPKLDNDYLKKIKRLIKIVKPNYYTDHIALTGCPGIDVGHLSPICFDDKTLQNVIDNVNYFQDSVDCVLALENITYHFAFTDNHYEYVEFINKLTEKTNCGLLLDLTNLHINAINHSFDSKKYIDNLPIDNVLHVHLSGEYSMDGILIDGHCRLVQQGTWDLLSYLTHKGKPKAIVLEHDADFPDNFNDLLDIVKRANLFL